MATRNVSCSFFRANFFGACLQQSVVRSYWCAKQGKARQITIFLVCILASSNFFLGGGRFPASPPSPLLFAQRDESITKKWAWLFERISLKKRRRDRERGFITIGLVVHHELSWNRRLEWMFLFPFFAPSWLEILLTKRGGGGGGGGGGEGEEGEMMSLLAGNHEFSSAVEL